MKNRINAISLFCNVGIAEAYYKEIGIDVKIANELQEDRAKFYQHIYPNTCMITGDITKKETKDKIIKEASKYKIDLIIATPPCQGMSTAGKMEFGDPRNALICHAVEIIKIIKPDYVFFENVPKQLTTKILVNERESLIPEFLHSALDNEYIFNNNFLIDAANYGVPQSRERAIILLTKKTKNKKRTFPKPDKKIITLAESIGNLPILDPVISDLPFEDTLKFFPNFLERKENALKISKWFYPPSHPYRQIIALTHTPSGKTAFDNDDKFKPKKKNGELIKGFKNTYKRQDWNKPACTITMYNRTISSQNNVHPGRLLGQDQEGNIIYSDARVFTIYELLILTSLPLDWNIPNWASENFIRSVIGEGIPPILTKKIMQKLVDLENE